MSVGSVTKHNVAEMVPASFALLSPSSLLPQRCVILKFLRSLTTWFEEQITIFLVYSVFSRLERLTTSGSILTWLSNRQQHCPSPAKEQELWGWITCGSLSLHVLSNLLHKLDWDTLGGAVSPSIGNKTTAAASVQSSFRLMRTEQRIVVSHELFCVELVSMIAE